jgi:hypothetical protein
VFQYDLETKHIKHDMEKKSSPRAKNFLLQVRYQTHFDHFFAKEGTIDESVPVAKSANREFYVKYIEEVIEMNFESGAAVLRERQMIPFARQCPAH